MRNRYFLLLITISIISLSCNRSATQNHPSFKSVLGIKFTEVKRVFNTGVSFSNNGYQIVPDWQLTFVSTDSVNIYSPTKKRFVNCPVIFDHDSVFNVAWAWLKLRKLSKDSVVFQVLHVENQAISDTRSNMFMTLYADNYIKNTLHTNAPYLQRATRKDTLYIKKRIAEVTNITDSAFAATEPAVLKSKSPLLKLEQVKSDIDPERMDDPLPAYMLPEYNINISKAYEDFYYSFTVIIDAQGEMHFYRSTTAMMPEFAESIKKTIRAITSGYLKHYLDVVPGKTLGMPHPSMVLFNVLGKKAP